MQICHESVKTVTGTLCSGTVVPYRRNSYFNGYQINNSDALLKIRFTNICLKSIILKPRSLIIKTGKESYSLIDEDFIGSETFEELMPPNSVREIGVFLDQMNKTLCIKSLQTYSGFNIYPLKIYIRDSKGKKYKTNSFEYDEATGNIFTKGSILKHT